MAKKKTLRALSNKPIETEDVQGIAAEISQVSDRTAAIVLASWVERALEQWIIQILPRRDAETLERLQDRDGPLSGFFAKIHLGYALSLYDAGVRDNLEIIRRIRNAFAHTPQAIDFKTEEIRTEVRKLKFKPRGMPDEKIVSEYREAFALACMGLVLASRLKPLGNKFELIKSVIDAINPHLEKGKQFPPDVSEKLAKAVELIKKVKP
jgi:hypothetical protein